MIQPKKSNLHPRNRHTGRYDFDQLIQGSPELGKFVRPNPFNELSIDFSDPLAVRTLNRALLKKFYALDFWEIPEGYLCPPIPGRADYIHHLADLLGDCNQGVIPQGAHVRALDVGVGASCIYPILGHLEYGWNFVGTDTEDAALASAQHIVASNSKLSSAVEIRKQPSSHQIFPSILLPGEEFDLTLCNPPFHGSLQEAQEGSHRKWKNLGKARTDSPVLNFGGKSSELWCPGGEIEFTRRMIEESVKFGSQVFWFSTLVSRSENLSSVYRILERADVADAGTVEMSQGQKKSRFVAWTFLDKTAQESWRVRRWSRL